MFQPGDVVACVDDRKRESAVHRAGDWPHVVRGQIYRVIEVFLVHDELGEAWGCIVDIDDPTDGGFWECDRFRKIDDEVTDEFREMMRNLKQLKSVINPARHRVEAK